MTADDRREGRVAAQRREAREARRRAVQNRGRDVCPRSGKLAYATFDLAAVALASVLTGGKPGRYESTAYECPSCQRWHLSSATGRQADWSLAS